MPPSHSLQASASFTLLRSGFNFQQVFGILQVGALINHSWQKPMVCVILVTASSSARFPGGETLVSERSLCCRLIALRARVDKT
ncbi:unnamed protein product [Arctogadus glacialis]